MAHTLVGLLTRPRMFASIVCAAEFNSFFKSLSMRPNVHSGLRTSIVPMAVDFDSRFMPRPHVSLADNWSASECVPRLRGCGRACRGPCLRRITQCCGKMSREQRQAERDTARSFHGAWCDLFSSSCFLSVSFTRSSCIDQNWVLNLRLCRPMCGRARPFQAILWNRGLRPEKRSEGHSPFEFAFGGALFAFVAVPPSGGAEPPPHIDGRAASEWP